MLLNKISQFYIKSYFYVLLNVVSVVVGFESLLHILRDIKHVAIPSTAFLHALLGVMLDIPHKSSEFLPLAIYISLGVQHYLWHQKKQWLTACVIGFKEQSFKVLKFTHLLLILLLSAFLSWYLSPQCFKINQDLQGRSLETQEVSFDLSHYMDKNRFYQFIDDRTAYSFNFEKEEFKEVPWRLSGKILYVDKKPVVDLEILHAEKKRFDGNTLSERVNYSYISPPAQKVTVEKSLIQAMLNPVCCILSLYLGWLMFEIRPHARSKRSSSSHFLPHVAVCSFIFLTQNILSTFFYLPWPHLLSAFLVSVFLILFFMLVAKDIKVN